ncbi:MAG: hypothetical protein AB7O24_06975 [Kofleriaceae bacterium]
MTAVALNLICEAIRTRSLLEFEYNGLLRIVAPYCHGYSSAGNEALRAIQVRGESKSRGIASGKLWKVAQIRGLRMLDEPFAADDPHYNPGDTAMVRIHCCV